MIEWDVVVADECHIIKERKSDVTEKMALVNARVRIGLTGTAIQNNYEVGPQSCARSSKLLCVRGGVYFVSVERDVDGRNCGLCWIGRILVEQEV
jgi:hypothetical protein